MNINASAAWRMIIKALGRDSKEFHTEPITNKPYKWFTATALSDVIYINRALTNSPSSEIATNRKLNLNEFEKIFPLYFKRAKGEKVSKEAAAITHNQVYYYSLIKNLVDNQ